MTSNHEHSEFDEDFEVVEYDLPLRSASKNVPEPDPYAVTVDLHQISASDEVLVSINPPVRPLGELKHTACDIVLVIDVSGSMFSAAELPDQAGIEKTEKETSGLCILDLVKHASKTILEKLNDGDRLAIVTFSTDAKVVQGLLPMTASSKELSLKNIESLNVQESTNLWAGIRTGLDVINDTPSIGNIQGMFVLTDGAPNCMCPSQGYVKKLQPMLKKMSNQNGAPIISTFGFGYYLRSDLLRSIAEVGQGNYAFIPDAGMIGTVFVHALANLFSTFAMEVSVGLECSDVAAQLSFPWYLEFDLDKDDSAHSILRLGNIQYGQSRNFVVRIGNFKPGYKLKATLKYKVPHVGKQISTTEFSDKKSPSALQAMTDYHLSRHELCGFIASFSTRNAKNEHLSSPMHQIEYRLKDLEELVSRIECRVSATAQIPAKIQTEDQQEHLANLTALLADLKSPDLTNPHGSGQIALALNTGSSSSLQTSITTSRSATPSSTVSHRSTSYSTAYYTRWGRHYLPSILHAHMRQMCATFKDPGPLRYGIHSPLFLKMREELDDAFDRLPPPKSSLKRRGPEGQTPTGPIKMARYHRSSNPCFGEGSRVKLADADMVNIEEMRSGDLVWTPVGARLVKEVVKTELIEVQAMCHINTTVSEDGGVWITPYHPVLHEGQWRFPMDVVQEQGGSVSNMISGNIYSVILAKSDDVNAHVVDVGGVLCVTLGHGLTYGDASKDARIHQFLGNYESVLASLERLETDNQGRRISGGIAKEMHEGKVLACRFIRPEETAHSAEFVRAHL